MTADLRVPVEQRVPTAALRQPVRLAAAGAATKSLRMRASGYAQVMRSVARLGQCFLAPMFVSGGIDAMRHPESKAAKAATVTTPVAETLGLPDEPSTFVRMNGAVQLLGGALLGIGVCTRLAACALTASLIPTTLAGHRFWSETEAKARATQRIQFLKNTAMLGGLLLVVGDRPHTD
jgi:putative oxidoreductase